MKTKFAVNLFQAVLLGLSLVGFSTPSHAQTPITCGQTITNTLSTPGQTVQYNYPGTAGQTLSVALFGTGAYLNGDWMVADIYGPDGKLLASVDGGSGGSGHAVNLTLTNSGTFLILVHESLYRAAYSYSLCVQSTTGGGCSSTAMLCGQSMSNKLSFNAEMDAYSCTGTAGQTLSVALFGTGAYLNGDWMVADIYSPGGQFLARVDGGSSGSGHAVNLTLTNSGTFTILVHESVYRAAYSYFLSIQSTTGGGCSSTAIVCGQTMTNNISRQAEVEAFGLGASSGTTVIFSFSGFGGAQFEFYDPAGSKLFTRTPGTSTNIMLATSGAYTLLVHDDNYADTGSYSFTANCIGCSYSISPTSVSIGAAATNGNVSVTAGAGCNWTAETNASWLRITSGASGSGNGSVNYLVDANLGANARAGTMTIAGWTFIVNQAAAVAFVGHDVGDVSPLGGFDPSNGVFTVWGDGEDIEGTADAFYFVHEPLTGDGQIVARLLSLQGGSGLAEAGLMMRETLASGSRHVFLAANADKATTFRRRLATDAYSVQNSHPGTNYAWLRLMRMGNTFVGHCSTNGTNWEYVWFTTLNMPSQLQVGLAVTARSLGLLATGMLDNVSVGSLTPLSGTRPQAIHLGGEPLNAAEWARIGGYKMLLDGGVGDQFMVKCSTNVSANFASWLSLGTVTNTLGVADFLDPQALTNKLRFYRTERVGP